MGELRLQIAVDTGAVRSRRKHGRAHAAAAAEALARKVADGARAPLEVDGPSPRPVNGVRAQVRRAGRDATVCDNVRVYAAS